MPSKKNATPLSGQTCAVTGGAQGLGWAVCQALAERGAQVHACDISPGNLEQARERLGDLPYGGRISLEHCDVADREAYQQWLTRVRQATGRLDMLVNNAAFVRWQDVLEMSVEDAELTMRVGYDAMVYGVKHVLPWMLEAGGGHIINIGSITGRVLVGSASASYCATKAAIDAYTQTLQVELRGSPVHVMLVRPATIAGTEFFGKHVPAARMPRVADFLPYLTPPQVAQALVEGVRRRTPILDIPGYNQAMQLLFLLAPGPMRWAMRQGGPGTREYGQVRWEEPKDA